MTRKVLTEAQQGFTFTRRALFIGGAQMGIGAVLAGRMAWLAIAENAHYSDLAESNRVQSILVPPRRGWIVDRSGKPIAVNRPDLRVDLIPDRVKDADALIATLRAILDLPEDEVERIHEDLAKAAGYRPVQVASNLDWDRYAAVNLRLADLPGVAPSRGFARHYPTGPAVGHLVGYVGAASAEDYEREKNPLLITPGFRIGKEGLEKTMDATLRGRAGAKRTEVTARGRLVRELTMRPEVPGKYLHLTVDAGLQDYAARRLGDQSGSVVVIDVAKGDMLAMASMPCYDPNSFSAGISHSEWNMLSADDHLPLVNKTLQGLYPPGSTVKPMNALALLEAGVDPNETVSCTGAYRVGAGTFHCWSRRGHGAINMSRAIAQSCDIYFYTMMRKLGIERLAAMARRLGLGEKYPLPVVSQRFGTVPDAAWKEQKYKKAWTVADTVNTSIGQGYMLTNPLQLAVMAARIASGRKIEPRLIHEPNEAVPPAMDVDPEHLALVREAMSAVVNGGGTAAVARLQVPGVLLAGKTGSAQVRRISMADRLAGRAKALGDSGEWRLRDHGHFICFAPADTPRYAAAVTLEHAGHGAEAAAVARDIMTYLFDQPRAMRTLEANEEKWGGGIMARMAAKSTRWRAAQAANAAPTAPTPIGQTPPAPPPGPATDTAAEIPPSPDVPR
ncbi:penicillin-binding protein 2 [Sphingomonas quercus]|uniref:Penicillin-binding protein 2 n=1 Tax=Sphingomonas quercus TaxID=2842451 RepID=A0ABS6BKQ1_9SPHN|nr:penicillin-binding protein 2 [Sphingomonas quercus]MBU3078873.1 penicillin-binding protein 2 [Sphingomonas quercus]